MAFMVPVMRKDWDIYGSSPSAAAGGTKSRRNSQQTSGRRARTTSETSQPFSRGPSFTRGPGSLSSSPANNDLWALQGRAPSSAKQSRSSSRASNLSQMACSAPTRTLSFGPRNPADQGPASPPPQSDSATPTTKPSSSLGGFHTKVVDRLMKALHLTDKEASRKA